MINKIKRYKKITTDFKNTRRMIKNIDSLEPHEIKSAKPGGTLGGDIAEAQKLHASVYLRRGFVDESDISGGVLTAKSDPHQQHALYFIVKKKGSDNKSHVAVTARQIEYHPDKGFMSFPLLEKADINLHMLKEVVGHDPKKCVEISGLAKHKDTASAAVLLLYRSMWHHSIKEKHELWIMACDVRLYNRLRLLFGPAIKKIGRETAYKGGDVIPAMLNPKEALYEFIRISRRRAWLFGISRRQLISFFVEGLPSDMVGTEDLAYIKAVLKNHE
jgi:hypothetical protein